jgi:hypothetical protein
MRIEEILNIENPVFRGYITWSGVVILKMLLMALLTSIQRYKNGVRKRPNVLQLENV